MLPLDVMRKFNELSRSMMHLASVWGAKEECKAWRTLLTKWDIDRFSTWIPSFFFKHRISMSEVPRSITEEKLKEFKPQHRWTVARKGSTVELRFMSADDAMLFKLTYC